MITKIKLLFLLFLLFAQSAYAEVEVSLNSPRFAKANETIEISLVVPKNTKDFITIVKAGTQAKKYEYYTYADKDARGTLSAPSAPGEYEIRLLDQNTHETITSRKLTVVNTEATVVAPARVVSGSSIAINWYGPNNKKDYITIVSADAPEGYYAEYKYTENPSPIELTAPKTPGSYEIRYMVGKSNTTLACAQLSVVKKQ
jgi:Ca-activated chloride channel family protein